MQQLAEKLGQFTYADYCRWPDEERWELIDGEAFNMSPAPTRMHQEFVTFLAAQVYPQLKSDSYRVYIAPFDVRLPKANEADDLVDTVVQPDLTVFCDPSRLDAKGARGAPDWVVEILSPHGPLWRPRGIGTERQHGGRRPAWGAHRLAGSRGV